MTDSTSPVASARAAMASVESGDRDRWLSAFGADAVVEDPVGHLPPLAGREALATFWDDAISQLAFTRFDISHEWEAGDEAMLLATVTIATRTGATASYQGTFNYRLDANGAIISMRAFWDLPAVAAALAGETDRQG